MKLLKSLPSQVLFPIRRQILKITSSLLLAIILLAGLSASPSTVRASGIVLYAKSSSTGGGDCTSWEDACTLKLATEDAQSGDQIWVQAGIHTPAPPNGNRTISFILNDGVAIYGGFNGTESNLEQRDPTLNVTILSGDLNGDDTDIPFQNNSENSHNVVYGNNASSAILDGVTIRGGNADGSGGLYHHSRGGGMYNNNSSPTVNHVVFSLNYAHESGAGMYNNISSPSLTHVVFSNNLAFASGGGMYNDVSHPTLTDVRFTGNYGTLGGGMYNNHSNPTLTHANFLSNNANVGGGIFNINSSPTLTHVNFSENESNGSGGGMFNNNNSSPSLTNVAFFENIAVNGDGAGMHNNNASNPSLMNVTFSGNRITNGEGGGIFNNGNSNPSLMNVTFTGNSISNGDGGGMFNSDSAPTLINVILWGNTASVSNVQIKNISSAPVVSYSIVQGSGGSGAWDANLGTDGGNNLDVNPLLGILADNGGYTKTHALGTGSPAIDKGTNTDCPAADPRGMLRPQGAFCDIGAFESAAAIRSNAKQDGWVLESNEFSNTGGTLNRGGKFINIGDDALNRQYRAILSFNTSSIPADAVITKVTLRLKRKGVTGGGNPINIFGGFRVDVRKGNFGKASLQLTDFNAKAHKTYGVFKPKLQGGWYTINLTKAKNQINKNGSTQIRLRFKLDDNNNFTANFLSIHSGNANAASRPQLIVDYYTP